MVDLVARMIRVAQLDAALYKEVEADRSALRQAITVVVLSSLAAVRDSGRYCDTRSQVVLLLDVARRP
jgi:hypothetical protein